MMKKIALLVTILILILIIVGCGPSRTEVSRKIVDSRYTHQNSKIETTYKYEYSWLKGEFVLVPDVHTIEVPESYEFLYEISYNDGTISEEWKKVDKETYISFIGEVK